MIIVPKISWRTFRYWAARASNVWVVGSSPGGDRKSVSIHLLTLNSGVTGKALETLVVVWVAWRNAHSLEKPGCMENYRLLGESTGMHGYCRLPGDETRMHGEHRLPGENLRGMEHTGPLEDGWDIWRKN